MKVESKVIPQTWRALRSEAQEKLDAAGGEKIAAQKSQATHATATNTYVKAVADSSVLFAHAHDLRAEAKKVLEAAVGPRGTFALANVARGFMTLMKKMVGLQTPTTADLIKDPTARATYEKLTKLADAKEKLGAEHYDIAKAAHKEAANALSEMIGHETAAANHKALAAQLMKDASALAAREPPPIPVAQKPVVAQPVVTKPAAEPAPTFEPGKVSFGGAPAQKPVRELPNIDAPPAGEKRPSESLVAARWRAEALGIDWTTFSSTGSLKDLVSKAPGGVNAKNSSSPFEVKKRISERLGLPTSNEAVHKLDLGTVRDLMSKREAVGLSRIAPKGALDKALATRGIEAGASLDQVAMQAMVHAGQAKDAKGLDAAKNAILEIARNDDNGNRHVLLLDTVDVLEFATGRGNLTTRIGADLESLVKTPAIASALKKGLGLDDAGFASAGNAALAASEWTTLHELNMPAHELLAHAPDDVAAQSASLAKDLGLVDEAGAQALRGHGAAGHLLALSRALTDISPRDRAAGGQGPSSAEIARDLEERARAGKLDSGLVAALAPVMDQVVAALRA